MTVLHVRADLYGKQAFCYTNMANRFSTVQYSCTFVLLFVRYLLQLDNKLKYFVLLCNFVAVLILSHFFNVHVSNDNFCSVRQNGGCTEWLSILYITTILIKEPLLEYNSHKAIH